MKLVCMRNLNLESTLNPLAVSERLQKNAWSFMENAFGFIAENRVTAVVIFGKVFACSQPSLTGIRAAARFLSDTGVALYMQDRVFEDAGTDGKTPKNFHFFSGDSVAISNATAEQPAASSVTILYDNRPDPDAVSMAQKGQALSATILVKAANRYAALGNTIQLPPCVPEAFDGSASGVALLEITADTKSEDKLCLKSDFFYENNAILLKTVALNVENLSDSALLQQISQLVEQVEQADDPMVFAKIRLVGSVDTPLTLSNYLPFISGSKVLGLTDETVFCRAAGKNDLSLGAELLRLDGDYSEEQRKLAYAAMTDGQ